MSFINWKLPVVDKGIFWDTLKTHNGWKFQQNIVLGQYRVINPIKYREAWGIDRDEIEGDFKRLSGYTEQTHVVEQPRQVQDVQPSQMASSRDDLYNELERLAELFERSAITEKEFNELRQIVLQKLKNTP